MNNPEHFGVLGEDDVFFGATEQELTRFVAKLKKRWPIYRGFNQGTEKRFWYACIIVSFLRTWFSLFGKTSDKDFESIMSDLCDHLEKKWVWSPTAGGYIRAIGDECVNYMNNRFPEKVWFTRVKDGSSAMGGCIDRNIPVITAYFSGTNYNQLKSDGTITELESADAKKGNYGHCVTFTGRGPMWVYREVQDNYEGRDANTYKIYAFNILKRATWQTSSFYLLLPDEK